MKQIRQSTGSVAGAQAPSRNNLKARLTWVERGLLQVARAQLEPGDMMNRAKLLATCAVLEGTDESPSEEENDDGE